MRGAIPPIPNTPPWHDAQFKKKAQGYLYLYIRKEYCYTKKLNIERVKFDIKWVRDFSCVTACQWNQEDEAVETTSNATFRSSRNLRTIRISETPSFTGFRLNTHVLPKYNVKKRSAECLYLHVLRSKFH
jgi:hypothetical protein